MLLVEINFESAPRIAGPSCASANVTCSVDVTGIGGSRAEAHRPMGGNTMDDEDRDPNSLNQHLQVNSIESNSVTKSQQGLNIVCRCRQVLS
jgi:hypothetical protein